MRADIAKDFLLNIISYVIIIVIMFTNNLEESMDDNFLDSLLAGAMDDSQLNSDFDRSVDADSGLDLDLGDLGDISLEELDDLEGLDLGDLDLDDIDFDDLDMMNLDVNKNKPKSEEDFNLDDLIKEPSASDFNGNIDDEVTAKFSDDVFSDADDALFEDLGMKAEAAASSQDDVFSNAEVADEQTVQGLFGNTGDNGALADMLDSASELDELLGDIEKTELLHNSEKTQLLEDEVTLKMGADNPQAAFDSAFAVGQEAPDMDSADMDDLFASLGLEDGAPKEANTSNSAYTKSESELDDMFQAAAMNMDESMFADIEDIGESGKKSKKKKKTKEKSKEKDGEKQKKSLSVILFGEPDADDIEEEERLAAKKEQKATAKEEKKAKNAEKKEEKKAAEIIKKENQRKEKQAKADKKKAALEAEAEEEKDAKQVPTPVVIIVFVIFSLVAGLAYFGSQTFHYSEVIRKAADYFDRQRYRLAYDEVSGVEVKPKDEELRDRIYTVMYVERLYESYDNNMKLNRQDKALDALLRGLEKYDEHYEEAVELDIVKDVDTCKAKIITALAVTYNLSETQARDMLALEGQEYLDELNKCCAQFKTGE